MTRASPNSRTPLGTSDYCLAIDQGGHASRALVFDAQGRIAAQGKVAVLTTRPAPGRVEHDAEALVGSVRDAVDQALCALSARQRRRVQRAGIATQRSSIVCWDLDSGAALSPVISWQDTRAAAMLGSHREDAASIHRHTGLVLSPHYGASKLHWCLQRLPAVRRALGSGRLGIGPLASFLVFRLLREAPALVDPCNGSRTLLCALDSGDWSAQMLERFAIPRAALPRIVPNLFDYGTIATAGIEVPLELCTGDQSAAVYAYGDPVPTQLIVNAGTGAFALAPTGARIVRAPGLLTSILLSRGAAERSYVLEGTVNGAASALHAVAGELGLAADEVTARLDGWSAACSDPPLFLNGVSGLGAPYWVSDFTSEFVGEGDAPARMVAVLESIVFLLMRNLDVMRRAGLVPQSLLLSGGLATLDGFCARLAALGGLPVQRAALPEATAAGLAWLLGSEACEHRAAVFPPRAQPALQARYLRWCELLHARL